MSDPTPASRVVSDALRFIGKLFLGFVFLLIFLEAGLQAASLFLSPSTELGDDDAEVTILAEGDSFTYGIGGLSFPAQLQEIFDERVGEGKVRLINEGIPGLTTGLLADRIEEHLKRYAPQVVVIVVGENDTWNSIHLTDHEHQLDRWTRLDQQLLRSRLYRFLKVSYLLRGNRTFADARSASHGAGARLEESREVIGYPQADVHGSYIVRDLTVWLNAGVEVGVEMIGPVIEHLDSLNLPDPHPAFPPETTRQAWSEALAWERLGDYASAEQGFRAVAQAAPDQPLGWYRLGTAQMRQGQWDQAVLSLQKAVALPDARAEVWFSLGHAHQRAGDVESAARAWLEGLERYPLHRPSFHALAQSYRERGKSVFSALDDVAHISGIQSNPLHEYLTQLRQHAPQTPLQELASHSMREQTARIISLAHAYGAEVILASYPHIGFEEIEQTAQEMGAHYVDFQPLFAERFADKSDYLSEDECHCNSVGYRFMAEHFYDLLLPILGWSRDD